MVSGLGDALRPETGPGEIVRVRAAICGLWLTPSSPRPIDAPMLSEIPDHLGWLRTLDAVEDPVRGRLGLEGRMLSEVVEGEFVRSHEQAGDWVFVTCSEQPSHKNPWGYPGYLHTAHIDLEPLPAGADTAPEPATESPRAGLVRQVRERIGQPHLAGGLSDAGLDAAGLVHLGMRSLGVRFPRDCADQQQATEALSTEDVEPGDLLFFARPGSAPHHVAVLVDTGRVVHIRESGHVLEEAVPAELVGRLVGAGRIRELG